MKQIYAIGRFWMMVLIFGAMLINTGCESTPSASTTPEKDTTMMGTSVASAYSVDMLSNQKDPSCGMPVSAGISDTAHYNKYVLGFCSSECKAEFMKNPTAMLAAAELKKEK
jgi:YHS domain-containing protein